MVRLIWRLLEQNWAYKLFRNWVGTESLVRHIVDDWQRATPGMKVLDLGCGTGDALLRLPAVDYVGVDYNADYVAMCQQRFPDRGQFVVLDLAKEDLPYENEFDLALLYGVLHHLDDDACRRLLAMAHKALKPGGRLITLDGVFHPAQSGLNRFVTGLDRGRFVREVDAYLKLTGEVFPQVRHEITDGRIKIPYSHIIMECQKAA